MSMKISGTPSRVEPEAFQLAAQCLNQLRHQQRAPLLTSIVKIMNSVPISVNILAATYVHVYHFVDHPNQKIYSRRLKTT